MKHAAVWLVVVSGIAGCEVPPEVCPEGYEPGDTFVPDDGAGFVVRAHAHNDYEHDRPLEDALAEGFTSVEADVYLSGGELQVGHYAWALKGALTELYLDPLQQLVDAQGSVHGDGRSFTLWVDLKEGSDEIVAALADTLADYEGMLTRFDDEAGASDAPVTVVLTGDARAKAAAVDPSSRLAIRDSNDFALDDPPADGRWGYYALNWGRYVGWDGDGAIPDEADRRMRCIAEKAHEDGRRVRFFAAPDHEAVWEAQLRAGVDFIHTDELTAAAQFLATFVP